MENMGNLVFLAVSWLVYFLIHSLTASLVFKQWAANLLPGLFPAYYRLFFNASSILLLMPMVLMMHYFAGDFIWQWQGIAFYVANSLAILAVVGFVWSMRFYDGMDFLGFGQIKSRQKDIQDKEKLCISPLHRVVRHPWYFFALVIIWTRDMDSAFLVSASCMTLYFIIGSMLEERKLVAFHGEAYRQYIHHVPGLLPLPWRYLDKSALEKIETLICEKEVSEK